jgi:hypothetical protein
MRAQSKENPKPSTASNATLHGKHEASDAFVADEVARVRSIDMFDVT